MDNKEYIDNYYEDKKKKGLILTKGRISGKDDNSLISTTPDGITWWSAKLGRYRTPSEQTKYVQSLQKIKL